MTKHSNRTSEGFTLIEMMTAVSIFLVVMTIALGSILSIFNDSKKSRSESTTMSNLSLTMESMAREMRYGTNYHCGLSGTLTTAQNCPAGDVAVSFFLPDGSKQIVYNYSGNTIYKSIDGGVNYTAVTAPELIVQDASFYVLGAGTGNTLQPKVLIKIKGYSGTAKGTTAGVVTRTEFTLQTLVSQRLLDN